MLMGSDARRCDPLPHGGDLAEARRLFPNAPEPFLDLSTGCNPYPYPHAELSRDIFAQLPDRSGFRRLAEAATQAYGAPSAECVVAAPGTQILLPLAAMLAPAGRAAVLGPTYAEHARAAALAGHSVEEVSKVDQLADADLAVVVNPNNPDGWITRKGVLIDLSGELAQRGGTLVVDEAFAEVMPEANSLSGEVMHGNVVVLRSFGKFYGLPGLRLGFAVAAPPIARRLEALLGPWPVSTAAIVIGERALADRGWKADVLQRLEPAARRLDVLLRRARLKVVGGTHLYRLAQYDDANGLFDRLGRAGIIVRRFAEHPTWLRFGLPANEEGWRRLSEVLIAEKPLRPSSAQPRA
jgi:cobalamin biosynthetic protein CobC